MAINVPLRGAVVLSDLLTIGEIMTILLSVKLATYLTMLTS